MSNDYQQVPTDAASAEALAARGLSLGLVDTTDTEAFSRWVQAETRGFHSTLPSDETLAAQFPLLASHRTTGVWDDTGADPATPIATVASWPTDLTVPGHTSVEAWAISAVTVAPTHRRRGIARALLEAELRTADALSLPVAMLTVSESTIYSRYGFAPAAMTADWIIDTQRANWTGPVASGRVHLLTLEQARIEGHDLIERVRQEVPGQIRFSGYLWERMLGLHSDDKELAKQLRFVRYDDADGTPQGFAIYRVTENEHNFSAHTLDLRYLVSATDDAYAGLWRYLLEMDLVSEVAANLRAVDEPVRWQVSDLRAARKTGEHDHLWVRILNAKAALETRRYAAPARIVFEVSDPLGFADGRVLLDASTDGTATVTPFDGEIPDAAAAASVSVNELGALYLGGVSAVNLAKAGRLIELRDGSAQAIDAAFRSPVAPWLSIWF
ncbi:MAG: GNAT family N-acetyltransferase [Homoserinimonas sp.]